MNELIELLLLSGDRLTILNTYWDQNKIYLINFLNFLSCSYGELKLNVYDISREKSTHLQREINCCEIHSCYCYEHSIRGFDASDYSSNQNVLSKKSYYIKADKARKGNKNSQTLRFGSGWWLWQWFRCWQLALGQNVYIMYNWNNDENKDVINLYIYIYIYL